MTEPARAVFLSYASQDAQAALKICEALRAAGIEVWFDQSELLGGDAWDQSIRKQIKSCALFIPVVSRHTHERPRVTSGSIPRCACANLDLSELNREPFFDPLQKEARFQAIVRQLNFPQ